MSDNVDTPHSDQHVLSFTVHGATAAQVEMEAFQRAAVYFGLLLGDKINEYLSIAIDTRPLTVKADGEVLVYEADVTVHPR